MIDLVGTRLGEFEVIRELGRGGMGVVFEAVQLSLNRRVALKVLGPGLGLSTRGVDRFRREAGAAARLHHTNIVPVYSTGEADGYHFYAMELIDGPSLDHVITQLRTSPERGLASRERKRPELDSPVAYAPGSPVHDPGVTLDHESGAVTAGSPASGCGTTSHLTDSGSGYFDTVAQMIAEVADALEHAHTHGIIHRDVKPANLLLASDGRLSLNDFGLARSLEEPGTTIPGEMLGTPAYMSPEQVAAGRVPIDHRTDIYSLGAALYELLVLRPPFDGTREQLLAQVLHKEPTSPRTVDSRVPVDLETICQKCLKKDPDERYKTARHLADDLRRFVNRFAIEARRASALTRFRKWVRRNPALAAAGLVACLAACAAGGFAWRNWEMQKLAAQEEAARQEKDRRAALDTAMTFALAGNAIEAEKKVVEAIQLGAAREDVSVVRALIALYSGNLTGAVRHCYEAIGAEPKSVTAYSLLSYAHTQLGEWEESERVLEEVKAMAPRDARDRFFFGLALGMVNPTAGIAEMVRAESEGPVPSIAPSLRAEVRIPQAMDTGTVADAEAALVDIETASGGPLSNNPLVINQRVLGNLIAATAYHRAGQPERRAEALRRAADAVADLERSKPESVITASARWLHGTYCDELTGKLDLVSYLKKVREIQSNSGVAFSEALNLFRLGRDDEAMAVLRGYPTDRYCIQLQLVIALTSSNPAHRAELAGLLRDLAGPSAGIERMATAFRYSELLPDRQLIEAAAARIRKDRLRSSAVSPEEQDAFLRFVERDPNMTADVLLRTMKTLPQQTAAHCQIGMALLAAGKRDEAKAQFMAAHRLGCFGWTPWEMATAFVIRMNADRNWPYTR